MVMVVYVVSAVIDGPRVLYKWQHVSIKREYEIS